MYNTHCTIKSNVISKKNIFYENFVSIFSEHSNKNYNYKTIKKSALKLEIRFSIEIPSSSGLEFYRINTTRLLCINHIMTYGWMSFSTSNQPNLLLGTRVRVRRCDVARMCGVSVEISEYSIQAHDKYWKLKCTICRRKLIDLKLIYYFLHLSTSYQ